MIRTFEEFANQCKKLNGQTLSTGARNKPFIIEVHGTEIFFSPQESGKRRLVNREETEEVLSLLEKSKDWSPGQYKHISYHASYTLAVAKSASA